MKHIISPRMNFVDRGPLFAGALLLAFFVPTPIATLAQTQPTQQNTGDDNSSTRSRRLSQPSDLAKENYEHLAAAPRQLQEVLVKDPGLLVELKRLAIKQATDDGQIVEDSSLTDQAIFDRLEQDIKFRSLATRLVLVEPETTSSITALAAFTRPSWPRWARLRSMPVMSMRLISLVPSKMRLMRESR